MSNTSAANSSKYIHILALCDSVAAAPGTALTGFGRVAHNLFSRFTLPRPLTPALSPSGERKNPPQGVPIDIWSIGFNGHGSRAVYAAQPGWNLIPAGLSQWNSPSNLAAFLRRLETGPYTHVFMIMDPDALSGIVVTPDGKLFSEELKRICRARGIRSLLYYPVDAPLPPPFDIIEAVTVAVTFTQYGLSETKRALGKSLLPVPVLPHGIDAHFTPVTAAERERYRAEFQVADGQGGQRPFLKAGDYLLLNVNKNEWRKDPLRSLEILKGLQEAGVPAKLVLRMAPTSLVGGIHLERAAEQLGLKLDQDWAHIGAVPEEHLRGLYGAADLALTTSLGEGWGFMATEALACGTPVALPGHTSLFEIGGRVSQFHPHSVLNLGCEVGGVCGYDTRVRHRVNLELAVATLERWRSECRRCELDPALREWMSWDRIAGEFMKLLGITSPAPHPGPLPIASPPQRGEGGKV